MLGLQLLRPAGDWEHDAADAPRDGDRCDGLYLYDIIVADMHIHAWNMEGGAPEPGPKREREGGIERERGEREREERERKRGEGESVIERETDR